MCELKPYFAVNQDQTANKLNILSFEISQVDETTEKNDFFCHLGNRIVIHMFTIYIFTRWFHNFISIILSVSYFHML